MRKISYAVCVLLVRSGDNNNNRKKKSRQEKLNSFGIVHSGIIVNYSKYIIKKIKTAILPSKNGAKISVSSQGL